MLRTVVTVIAALLVLEAGVFYARHADLVRLAAPRDTLVVSTAFPELAARVLRLDRPSRSVLERVSDVASARGDHALQVRALQRIVESAPEDREARLRLAQAWRLAGDLDEAERLYQAELAHLEAGAGR